MGLRINTNIQSLQAQRNLARTSERLSGNFRKLSTGLRISSAGDDAAGLAIAERLRARARSLDQAARNANDGISLVSTGEGGLSEISNILVRLRELSIQANTDTTSDADKDTLNNEFQSLIEEIDRISQATDFNGVDVLSSSATLTLHIGDQTTASVDTLDLTLQSMRADDLNISSLNIGSAGNPEASITAIDSALDTVNNYRASLGAIQNRLTSTVSHLNILAENLRSGESRIRDLDVARETADLTRNNIIQQAGVAILAQANAQPNLALQLLG
ncbi:MAG: flagellin [Planctomycetota bacterium]